MKTVAVCGLLLAACIVARAQDPYADSVVSYVPGTGINTSFETSSAALGAPVSGTDGSTPYSIVYPAYKKTQIVGVGEGGELTLAFDTPITNDPEDHADGMDFTIFGNDFFALGSGGMISGAYVHSGLTVWVSEDNLTYYELKVPNGYGADDSFPEQGNGNPFLPVNPALSLSNFSGETEAQALSLYDGSAGGASFSISWAEDANGDPVDLPSISYVEIEGGSSSYGYVDAVSRVETVPEPSGLGLALGAMAVLLAPLAKRKSRG